MTTMRIDLVRMTLKWRVAAVAATPIMSALQTVLFRTRTERGCVGGSLSTEIGPHVEIRYVVDWESEGDLQRQIRSNDFSQLAELMERATEPPTIEFALPSGMHGMEYAEKIRRQR